MHIENCKIWLFSCIFLVFFMSLYFTSRQNTPISGLKISSFLNTHIFGVNKFKISRNQTPDARLPCGSSYTDVTWSPQLSGLAETCSASVYLQFDSSGQSHLTSDRSGIPGNATCPRLPIRAPFPLPSTGLVSWPGSGNTWTRHLIQQLTGLWTGAVYNDAGLKRDGFQGEGQMKGVVVIKTHFTAVKMTLMADFDKQILIIRNPYDAFAAEFKRGRLGAGHRGKVNINPNTTEWLNYVPDKISRWPYFIRASLAFTRPQLIVMYEDLKECLLRELVYIAKFLQTPHLQKFTVCCAYNNSEGRNYRKMNRSPLYQLYQPKFRATMNSFLSDMSERMAREFPVLSKRLLDYQLL